MADTALDWEHDSLRSTLLTHFLQQFENKQQQNIKNIESNPPSDLATAKKGI